MTIRQAKQFLIAYARDETLGIQTSRIKDAIKTVFPEAGVIVTKKTSTITEEIMQFLEKNTPVTSERLNRRFKISLADMIKHIKLGYGFITMERKVDQEIFHYIGPNYGLGAQELKVPEGHRRMDNR